MALPLLAAVSLSAENLIENGDFELTTTSSFFGTTKIEFEDWSWSGGMEALTIETADVHGGEKAMKISNNKNAGNLSQEISLTSDEAGQQYELTVHYKTNDAGDGDLTLNSAWECVRDNCATHDSNELNQQLPLGTGWKKLKVNTTKPENGSRLTVSIKVNKGSFTVLFDNFSLVRLNDGTTTATATLQADEAQGEMEIYTMSGQRVRDLQPGINIIRQGDKTYKVVR